MGFFNFFRGHSPLFFTFALLLFADGGFLQQIGDPGGKGELLFKGTSLIVGYKGPAAAKDVVAFGVIRQMDGVIAFGIVIQGHHEVAPGEIRKWVVEDCIHFVNDTFQYI